MIKLIKAPQNTGYRQETQKKNVLFSVATMDWEANTATEWFAPVRCRDYLGDIQFSKQFKTPAQIYGFNFDYTTVTDDPDFLNLLVYFGEDEWKCFKENFPIMLKIEEENHLKPTEILETDSTNVFLFKADKFWKSDTHLISLYSWLPRLLSYKINNLEDWVNSILTQETSNYELQRLRTIRNNFADFIKDMHNYQMEDINTWEAKYKIGDISYWHNYTGIYSYLLQKQKQS
jgi:hypothetical protein